jgi:drug/metabolite transporter (DMT)-like permease
MGIAAALIGGGWQVATRSATTSTLPPADLMVLRYTIPALVLLPLALRTGLWPRGVPKGPLLLMICGAGLPFGWVAMVGTLFSPPAHMGVLMASASPLIAAGLAWALWRERPDAARAGGLLLMTLGVLLMAMKSLSNWSMATWRGDAAFLLAAALWAGYTLSFRRSGLGSWQAAALVNGWSAVAVLAWLLWQGEVALLHAPAADVAWQVLWQGVLAGLFGLWSYSVAIARLGAAPAAAFGALTPVVSALGGAAFLGDRLDRVDGLAIAAAATGVLLASGAVKSRKARTPRPRNP